MSAKRGRAILTKPGRCMLDMFRGSKPSNADSIAACQQRRPADACTYFSRAPIAPRLGRVRILSTTGRRRVRACISSRDNNGRNVDRTQSLGPYAGVDNPDLEHGQEVAEIAGDQSSLWLTTLMTLPSGSRTKNRRTPHGSSVSGWTIP